MALVADVLSLSRLGVIQFCNRGKKTRAVPL
jgi:hypothetical protein